MEYLVNESLSRAAKFAAGKIESGDPETIRKMSSETIKEYSENRSLKLVSAHTYFTKRIDGGSSGRQEIIKRQDDELDGVRNISQAKLNDPFIHFVDRIYIAFGFSDNTGDEASVRYSSLIYSPNEITEDTSNTDNYATPRELVAPVLENSEVYFSVGNNYPILNEHPLTDFLVQDTDVSAHEDPYHAFNLEVPQIIPTGEQFDFQLVLPEGESLPATPDNVYVRVGLRGVMLAPVKG